MKTISILTMLLFIGTVGCLTAGDFNKAGRTSLQFLKIGIGARPAALGEAGIANMDDVNSIFWNPAAITGIDGVQASFSYTRWFADMNITAGAIGLNVDRIGVFVIDYIGLNYGDIQEALRSSPTGGVDTRTGDMFTGGDLAVGFGFSRMYTDKLSIGVHAKYLREELFTYTSSLWAFDVGTYYDTGWKGIRLAMSAQNFAGQARWLHTLAEEQQKYELPLIYRIGWSIDILGGENLFLGGHPDRQRLSFNMDAVHTNDYAERLHLGAEYSLFNLLALRSGYRFNYEEGNLSLGGGIHYESDAIRMSVDYAYLSYDFLDSPHRLTMTIAF